MEGEEQLAYENNNQDEDGKDKDSNEMLCNYQGLTRIYTICRQTPSVSSYTIYKCRGSKVVLR